MKPIALKPILDKEKYSDLVAKQLEFELYSQIFRPILEIFGLSWAQVKPSRTNSKEMRNAKGHLIDAILGGIVTYSGGEFSGKFTASISKELKDRGAKFDTRKKTWKIAPSALSTEIAMAIGRAKEAAVERVEKAQKALEAIQKTGLNPSSVSTITDNILQDLNKQFIRTTTGKDIEIPMAMSGYIEQELKTKYTENLDLYIKTWSDEAIVRLRGQIEDNASQGYRAESMRQSIIAEYGVSAKKAKFLARNETSIMVANYREANYKEAGINFYMWSSSGDQRVRKSHRELDGRIFSWSDPPIVDPQTGRRAHPGCDYQCRCVSVPILQSQMQRITEMSLKGNVFSGNLVDV